MKSLLLGLGLEKIGRRLQGYFREPRSLFLRPRPQRSPPEIYDAWLKSQAYQIVSQTVGLPSGQKSQIVPKILLVDCLKTPLAPDIDRIVSSLKNQTWRSWELIVLVSGIQSKDSIRLVHKLEKWRKKGVQITLIQGEYSSDRAFSRSWFGNFQPSDLFVFLWGPFLLAPKGIEEIIVALEKDADFFYCDEDKVDPRKYFYFDPIFKPDWSPDTLRSHNYVGSFFACKGHLLGRISSFQNAYDLVLQLTEKTTRIVHVPQVLAHFIAPKRKSDEGIFINILPPSKTGSQQALEGHLRRLGFEAEVTQDPQFPIYRIRYKLTSSPLVSIIIPNKDHLVDLKRCVASILSRSTYPSYELIIIENNSQTPEIFAYYDELSKQDPRIKVLTWAKEFNYSAINNFAVHHSKGQQLLFLNNDIEVITPTWMEELLMYSMRDDVGLVGAKLLYPDETIQHAGVILGMRGLAAHVSRTAPRRHPGYCYRLNTVRNLTAVTAACSMIKRSLFDEISGFDESLIVAFNDIDLCLKTRAKGKLNIFTPHAELFHFESLSRGFDDTPEKQVRFQKEVNHFFGKWDPVVKAGDPYYNVNLSLENEEIKLRT